MKSPVLLILLNAITHITALGVVVVGSYLLIHGHSTAGGWTIACGYLAMLFGGYGYRSTEKKD